MTFDSGILAPMLRSVLLVGLGGAAGSILRYIINIYINKWFHSAFPAATFTANIIGCLIIGMLFGLFAKGLLSHPYHKFLLVTGFCGGFTTFSTFSSETLLLLQSGNGLVALSYVAFSIVLGLAAVWLGMTLIKGVL